METRMTAVLRTGPWRLTDLVGVPQNGLKVFSCFHCGGGSTLGYKLAGYDVMGGVEIDEKMMGIYRANHRPRHSYLMGVQQFKALATSELPAELLEIDILDGSPPCSSFSTAGAREKKWGKKSLFREGQAEQVLDDLFFHFIDIAAKLRPKVVIAENVKGLIAGAARGYVKQIFAAFAAAGYEAQLFLLNSSRMGVPQGRERTFFVARRADLALPPLTLAFDEPLIPVAAVTGGIDALGAVLPTCRVKHWNMAGRNGRSVGKGGNTFGFLYKLTPAQPCATIQSNGVFAHWHEPRVISDALLMRLQSFPDDFDFNGQNVQYVCGMSVPPFMMQRVAGQIERQWFGGSA